MPSRLRPLLAPALATVVALAVLISLGVWQLERKAWKESLVEQIESRAHGAPGDILPEAQWPMWRAADDEFRRVRVTGTYLPDKEVPVHGLLSGQPGSALAGYYLFTPLRLAGGAVVMVNRGFVPNELGASDRRPSPPSGEVTVTGLVRAPEARGWFLPENDPSKEQWFVRDTGEMARARDLPRAAPFWIDLEPTPQAVGWPRPGQTQLAIPNNHLQYAFTWFGIALTLVGVFGTWGWQRIQAAAPERLAPPARPS